MHAGDRGGGHRGRELLEERPVRPRTPGGEGQQLKAAAGPALLAALLHAALLANYLAAWRGDPSALVCADEKKLGRWPFEAIRVGFPNDGYDGQYYYAVARQPWSRASPEAVDLPAYRHLRILYPALAWAASGGDPVVLLWALPAINLAAITALAVCGSLLALHHRRSAWWGCLLPLVLNVGMPALRDLTDPLGAATLCAVLAAWRLGWKTGWLAAWTIAAVLSREQNAAIVLLLLGEALFRRRWREGTALAVALAVLLAWTLTLRAAYGEWPVIGTGLGAPFSGIRHCLSHLGGRFGRPPVINLAGMAILLLQLGLCGWLLIAGRADRMAVGLALAGVALAVAGGAAVYQSGWSYSRAFVWMPLGIWLWSVESGRRWPVVLCLAALFWPISASVQPWLR